MHASQIVLKKQNPENFFFSLFIVRTTFMHTHTPGAILQIDLHTVKTSFRRSEGRYN